MKAFIAGLGALALLALASPAGAQRFGHPTPYGYPYGYPYVAPAYPLHAYGYPAYAYYPYPLPPAPSLGFGRGGIYGRAFVGRGESITGFTLPGGR